MNRRAFWNDGLNDFQRKSSVFRKNRRVCSLGHGHWSIRYYSCSSLILMRHIREQSIEHQVGFSSGYLNSIIGRALWYLPEPNASYSKRNEDQICSLDDSSCDICIQLTMKSFTGYCFIWFVRNHQPCTSIAPEPARKLTTNRCE